MIKTGSQKTIPQTQAMFDNYGELNGDKDIIHYDDAYAKARGFRGTLGHGLMYTGYVCDLAAKKYGAGLALPRPTDREVCARSLPRRPSSQVIVEPDGTVECRSQFDTTLVGSATLA